MAIWSINSKESFERKEEGKAQKFLLEDDCSRNPRESHFYGQLNKINTHYKE